MNVVDTVVLNRNTDDELICYGYRDSGFKKFLFYMLCVITLGLILLVMYWKPKWKIKLTKSRCLLSKADTVVLKDAFKQTFVSSVEITHVTDGPRAVGPYTYMEGELTSPSSYLNDTTRLTDRPGQRVCFKYFDHFHVRYAWNKEISTFIRLRGLDYDVTCAEIHDNYTGLSEDQQAHKYILHSSNSIIVEVKSYFRLFIEEVLNPFYLFQIASIILWSLDNYYIYASCIFVISSVSLGVSLYETRKQSVTLRDMVSSAESKINVILKDGSIKEVCTNKLVPGDVVLIPAKGCIMMCDAVLVSGNAIVNESMLTGESVPVTKTPIAASEGDEYYNPDAHKRHTLFCGTHVIQTRYYGEAKVKAVVVRTGFSTAKGELVRSILFPKPMGFKFYQDAMRFVMVLAAVATVGMSYSVYTLVANGVYVHKVILRALDIITIVVPPALPAAMTVGTVYAQNRLKKAGIFCISPPRINVCGKISCVVFDKTGTLTEEGLDLWGVVHMEGGRLQTAIPNPTELDKSSPFITAMATCHSLTIIDNELTGDPLDHKMFNSINWILEEPGKDTAKFDSLMPTIVKPITRESYYSRSIEETPFEVGIVRQFTFSSGLQRMSVITRTLGKNFMEVYCKGAPEKVMSLCVQDSIPADFHDNLQRFTIKGFRVIALAYKTLPSKVTWHQAQRMPRDQVESDLTFLGFLIMENTLKPQTTPVIKQLHKAKIRTVMATGDNMLTALSVARQCSMVPEGGRVILVHAYSPEASKPARINWELANTEDNSHNEDLDDLEGVQNLGSFVDTINSDQSDTAYIIPRTLYQQTTETTTIQVESDTMYRFAMTGRSFMIIRQHFPELISRIVVRGCVFARMSPDQKSQLVEHLQDLDYTVGMCGDGANDCGALKTAHAGISLSEAEASVASPFTSRVPHIECVPTVIREGRAALVTSFGVFKYMALYSIIQFVSVLILYTFDTNLGDWMFLYIDLIIITTLVILMGHTDAYPHLVSKKPQGSLMSINNIMSLGLHIASVIMLQAAVYMYTTNQYWFIPAAPNHDADETNTYETTVIFYISAFQYLIMAFIFSKGPPYRKPIYTNWLFLISLLGLTAMTVLLTLYPFTFIQKLLQMKDIPDYVFRLTILGMAALNFMIAVVIEGFVTQTRVFNKCINVLKRKKGPNNKFKRIEKSLSDNPLWPPVGEVTIASDLTNSSQSMSNGGVSQDISIIGIK